MLPKHDILLKLAEIEESLNQLEQSLYERISVEEQEGNAGLEKKCNDLNVHLASIENKVDSFVMNKRQKSFVLEKLELSYKTS